MMIIIYVSVSTPPENTSEFEDRLRRVVDAAKNVEGCLRYEWFKNPDSSNQFTIYGEFDSEENFALYKQSNVVEMIGRQLLPLTMSKPTYKHFRAEVFEQG